MRIRTNFITRAVLLYSNYAATPLATKVDKMRSVQLPSRRGLTSYSTYVFWCLRARQAALM